MSKFVSKEEVEKMLRFAEEICNDCTLSADHNCYSCDIYWSIRKHHAVLRDLERIERGFCNEQKGK